MSEESEQKPTGVEIFLVCVFAVLGIALVVAAIATPWVFEPVAFGHPRG